MLRRLCVVTVLFGAAAIFMTAAPAFASTSIGMAVGDTICGVDGSFFQTSGSTFVVPSGNWTLTDWSTQAGSGGGEMAAVVVRPTGTPGEYTVVGTSATEELTPDTVNTFTTSIAVKGGDILGAWATADTTCGKFTDSESDTYSFNESSDPPPPGTTLIDSGFFGFTMDIAGTLSPGAGAVIPQVDNVYVCYSKYEQDGGAVFPAAQAAALIAEGAWLPSAVAGNVDGGDNVGAYHLECNPPSNLQPTGMYVGLGGDVVSTDVATAAKLGYYAIVA